MGRKRESGVAPHRRAIELGQRLRDLRKSILDSEGKPLTQAEFGRLAGLVGAPASVSQWENGRNFPSLENLYSLSDQIGISICALFEPEVAEARAWGDWFRALPAEVREHLVGTARLLGHEPPALPPE